jgi:predicted ABC-type ATPase
VSATASSWWRCIVIAVPNGAGKTTFLAELDRLARAKVSFAFQATLSGLTLASRLKRWRASGYRIEIVYLRVSNRSAVPCAESPPAGGKAAPASPELT